MQFMARIPGFGVILVTSVHSAATFLRSHDGTYSRRQQAAGSGARAKEDWTEGRRFLCDCQVWWEKKQLTVGSPPHDQPQTQFVQLAPPVVAARNNLSCRINSVARSPDGSSSIIKQLHSKEGGSGTVTTGGRKAKSMTRRSVAEPWRAFLH